MPVYAGVVPLIFAFTSIIVIVDDCLVKERQARVMNTATRANAIVNSLFPTMVRERVFRNNENRAKSTTPPAAQQKGNARWSAMGALKPKKVQFGGDTPKKRLKSFLPDSRESSGKMKAEPMMDLVSEPITDLFPETFIIFAGHCRFHRMELRA